NVTVEVPLSLEVRLAAPDECDICSADAGKLRGDRVVESLPRVGYGEVDKVFPLGGEIRGLAALVERPSDMVESGAEVVDDVSEQESPMLGEGILEARNSHDDVTTLCVVFRPKSDWYLDIALTRHGSCLPC